jgi:hypothetical protein
MAAVDALGALEPTAATAVPALRAFAASEPDLADRAHAAIRAIQKR